VLDAMRKLNGYKIKDATLKACTYKSIEKSTDERV
jgi:hypothetical protein